MNKLFLKLYLVLFIGLFQSVFAQNNADGLSDGTLNINSQKIPVKIFATQDPNLFLDNSRKPSSNAELVILTKDNIEPASVDNEAFIITVISNYKNNGFQLLDKTFQPRELTDIKALQDVKYLYKSQSPTQLIKSGDKTELETSFKIWDPSTGIPLGPFTLHYYSLMFVFAFGLGYILMKKIFTIDNVDEKFLDPFFTWTLVGTILGARLGHVIFYQPELFKQDFLSVFLPISTRGGLHFTGFSGLASHGATIALIFTTLYYSIKIIKKNPLWVYDRIGIVVALGGAFVRMGNFFNSEIIGKPVSENSPFAILFPQQSSEYGLTIPRYPTQLFEAVGYVLLFVLLWFLYRKTDKKYQQGWLFGLFFIILWAIRFFVEFLKEPQGNEFIQIGGLNTGQVLSIPFMLAGLVVMIYSKKFKLPKDN